MHILEEIKINEVMHSFLIRGDVKNPILLFLHGGPGCSELGLISHFNAELEKHFLVINYDQRGSCKSFMAIDQKTMNLEQLLDDLLVIIKIMLKRYKKENIYLAGHSFGTLLGIIFCKKYPNLIKKYIGVSQVVDLIESEMIANNRILDIAIKKNNLKAIKDIRKVNSLQSVSEDYVKRIAIDKIWIKRFGGSFFGEKNLNKLSIVIINSPVYNWKDLLNYPKANEEDLSNYKLESLL